MAAGDRTSRDVYTESLVDERSGVARVPKPYASAKATGPKRGRKLLPRHPIVEEIGDDKMQQTYDVLDNNALLSLNSLPSVSNLGECFSVDKCYHATKFSGLIKKRSDLVSF